jgi:hypothetical protein
MRYREPARLCSWRSQAALAHDSEILTQAPTIAAGSENKTQNWNWNFQNTDIVQGYPGFSAQYSGPKSLQPGGQVRETISLDLLIGARLWPGAEPHVDGLMWQGLWPEPDGGGRGFSQWRGVSPWEERSECDLCPRLYPADN